MKTKIIFLESNSSYFTYDEQTKLFNEYSELIDECKLVDLEELENLNINNILIVDVFEINETDPINKFDWYIFDDKLIRNENDVIINDDRRFKIIKSSTPLLVSSNESLVFADAFNTNYFSDSHIPKLTLKNITDVSKHD